MTTSFNNPSHTPPWDPQVHRAPRAPPSNSPSTPRPYIPLYVRNGTAHRPWFQPRRHAAATASARRPRRPRPDKVWVAVELGSGPDTLLGRTRPATSDKGGILTTVLDAGVLESQRRIRNPERGRFAPSDEVNVKMIHHSPQPESDVGEWIGPCWTAVSTARGPYYQEILDAIHGGGTWAGAAYTTRGPNPRPGDTQMCVSGSQEEGESPLDTAEREVWEELGLIGVEFVQSGLAPRTMNGVTHHLVWAVAR
jgi:hypothetical protein